MCGILGLLAEEINRPLLKQGSAMLTHRGPDDAGFFVGQGIGLASRRLEIIDLEQGHQPLCNEDETVWITFNGEIVNAPELRQQLTKAGHRFRTRSDTEVIVHAYEEWGTDCFGQLRGMFAFALWDGRLRKLILVRDRFGIKPLYYAQSGRTFAFASEIRPLFQMLPDLTPEVNSFALCQLFASGHISTPSTAFRHVYKLPPAHSLVFSSSQPQIGRYWQPSYAKPETYWRAPDDEVAARFTAELRQTVSAWRLSDVPVGSLLSGGIDSAALAALLTEISGPIHTFHIRFAASSHDESTYAERMAHAIGSRHHTITFSETDFNLLPEVINHLEEPQCSMTSLPIYLLYRACRDAGFKVILTGEGADELFGGYHWYDGDRRIRPWLRLPRQLRRHFIRLPLKGSAAGRRVLAYGDRNVCDRFDLWQQVTSPALLGDLMGGKTWKSFTECSPASHVSRPPQFSDWHPLNQLLYLESQTRMVDFINFEVDRMSMANSVEARPPFLDHLLWQFVARLPPEMKLGRSRNKRLLRMSVAGLLPDSVVNRPKQGLASPHAAWWRRPRLPAWAEENLHPTALAETGYFQPSVLSRLREEHRDGRRDHSRVLTGILTTQIWHQSMKICG